MNRTCVIYKITSPSGKIYIGSTLDVKKRFGFYEKLKCKSQIRLLNSFKSHGFINHKIEIIDQCFESNRNIKESYWGMLFDVLGKNGLNCRLPSKDQTYPSCRKEQCEKQSKFMKGRKHLLGHKHTEETKLKISLKSKGKNNGNFGKKHTKEQSLQQSIRQKGLMVREKHALARKVIDQSSNKIWNCVKDCADELKIKYSTLVSQLNGTNSNKTNLKYYEN